MPPKYGRNIFCKQWFQEMFNVVPGINFSPRCNETKFGLASVADPHEAHHALWMALLPKFRPRFLGSLSLKFVINASNTVHISQKYPALINCDDILVSFTLEVLQEQWRPFLVLLDLPIG